MTRGSLVVKYRLQGRRVPGSKPDSTEDPRCMWACSSLNHTCGLNDLLLLQCGVEAWTGMLQLRCRPRHLTAAQNYEVRPKIALMFFQNGALIQLS
ncbi:hypothetical protein AVEN_143801-1 [Araneus ventricosus]|uniref:Uncharacterized protein n=1 Tax=Araneus ventricosus TaxID=182803 RepID=A0A4Y2K564_ARAVE|nr:hypothetical protein AVEN_143801-1 [Araneus ventricosus]